MNARPVKYDFSNSFSAKPAETVQEEKISAEALEAARAEAHKSGYVEGYTEGQNSAEIQAMQALDAKAQALFLQASATLTQMDAISEQIAQDSIRIAATMAKTLARTLLTRFPQETIAQLAEECFRHMRNTPHIVFRVAPELVSALEARLQKSADGFGFAGRIIILGDPEFMNGDVRIEWADGGYEYNAQKIEQELEACVTNWLNAQTQAPEGRE